MNFVHGTHTGVGAGTVTTTATGVVGEFSKLTGLVQLDSSAANSAIEIGGSADLAITFASLKDAGTAVTDLTATGMEAKFEAALQYNLTGTAAANTITTGGLADTIDGGAGNDTIDGGAGNDTITGGAGNDAITLGSGADTLVFNSLTGDDTVTSYVVADDTIQVSKAVYSSLSAAVGAATLGAEFISLANAAALTGGSVAGSTNAEDFIYLQDTKTLYYNADGATAGNLVVVATFTGVTGTMAATEFTVIA